MENKEPNEDRFQSKRHSEVEFSSGQAENSVDSGVEENSPTEQIN